MQKSRIVQVFALVTAITLLSAYVVYSQLKRGNTIASSSKSLVLTNRGANATSTHETNSPAGKSPAGSNAIVRLDSGGGTNVVRSGESQMVIPGSKSGAIFVPPTQAQKK